MEKEIEKAYEEHLEVMRPIWTKIILGIELTEQELKIAK